MTYELAKQLKDAGFPPGSTVITNNKECENPNCLRGHAALYCHSAYAPALSELIEACGKDFISLRQKLNVETDHAWFAIGARIDSDTFTCFGPTPEEAVANLWIALNKK